MVSDVNGKWFPQMGKLSRLYTILLPRNDNDRIPFESQKLKTILERISYGSGGIFVHSNSEGWSTQFGFGNPIVEPMAVVKTAIADVPEAEVWMSQLLEDVRVELQQYQIFALSTPVYVLTGDPSLWPNVFA